MSVRTPSRWPRPPRFLGIGTILRLAACDLRARTRSAMALAVPAAVAGGVAAGAEPPGPDLAWPQIGVVALVALAAAVAMGTHPQQRSDAALLVRLGSPRATIRMAAWVSTLVSVGGPAVLGAALSGRVRSAFGVVALTGVGAWSTAGARLPERAAASRSLRLALRGSFGMLLVLVGALLPIGSNTGSSIDLALPVGTAMVLVGIATMAPVLALAAGALASAPPSTGWRVAGSTLRRQHRGLTLPILATAGAACVLVTQGILGQALGDREADRRAQVRALGPAVVAGPDDVLVVDAGLSTWDVPAEMGGARPTTLAGRVAAALPEAEVIPVRWLDAELRSGELGERERTAIAVPGFLQGDDLPPAEVAVIALAEPELLRALAVDPDLGGDRVIVLDHRAVDGETVRLVPITRGPSDEGASDEDLDAEIDESTAVTLPAVVAPLPAIPTEVPIVLVPPAMAQRSGLSVVEGEAMQVLARFDGGPARDHIDAIEIEVPGAVVQRGDRAVDLAERDRTDRVNSVWVRDGDDIQRLTIDVAAIAALASLVGLVALRLAVRDDRAILELLGASKRTQLSVSAAGGIAVSVVSATLGTIVALAATRLGIGIYNAGDRATGAGVIAPLTWSVPATVWLGLLALPAITGLGALLIAALADPGAGRRSGHRHQVPSHHV